MSTFDQAQNNYVRKSAGLPAREMTADVCKRIVSLAFASEHKGIGIQYAGETGALLVTVKDQFFTIYPTQQSSLQEAFKALYQIRIFITYN